MIIKKLINKKGFTMIELLVVISIIGILVALSVFGLNKIRESARDARRKADLETIRSALELYKSDCGRYPSRIYDQNGKLRSDGGGWCCGGCWQGGTRYDTYDECEAATSCSSVGIPCESTCNNDVSITYLESTPVDPLSNKGYVYQYSFFAPTDYNNPQEYQLSSKLETDSVMSENCYSQRFDPPINLWCRQTPTEYCNYCVIDP